MAAVGKIALWFDLMGIKDVEAIIVKLGMKVDHKHVYHT